MNTSIKVKIFVALIILSVVSAVGYALYLIGSPVKQRALQLDRTRVSDLQQISSAIAAYWENTGNLPETFKDVQDQRFAYIRSIKDPETEELYEYRVLTEDSYELCAVFERSSKEQDVRIAVPFSEEQWEHEAGRVCFEKKAQAASFPRADRVPLPIRD